MKHRKFLHATFIVVVNAMVASTSALAQALVIDSQWHVSPRVSDLLTSEGRWDLEAARLSGYEGPVDLSGFHVTLDPVSGQLIVSPAKPGSGYSVIDDSLWSADFSGSLDNVVYALAIYNSQLIAGGDFMTAGSSVVNHVAAWTGSEWEPLGTGVIGDESPSFLTVMALLPWNGRLIAGGHFTMAGGTAANNIAAWDGVAWGPLHEGVTGGYESVLALAEYQGSLIVGGHFQYAGGVSADRIASWDGTSWHPFPSLGSGASWSSVQSLLVHEGKLIAGGTMFDGQGLGLWDGTSWELPDCPINDIYAMTLYGGRVIVGGGSRWLYAWDGSTWSTIGSPFGGTFVYGLTVRNDTLYAGGAFSRIDGALVFHIAAWDGTSWSALGSGVQGLSRPTYPFSPQVRAMTLYNGDLVVGGFFSSPGGVTAENIAQWNGSTWNEVSGPAGQGLIGNRVECIANYQGEMIVGGNFISADGIPARHLAAWNGSGWHAFGPGANRQVYSLLETDSLLIVGGAFDSIGGLLIPRLAAYDGSSWSPIGTPDQTYGLGAGPYSLAIYDGKLVAEDRIWDGSTWANLGTNGRVWDLEVFQGRLYAGGEFTTAGGVSANYIAAWDGAAWHPLGQGTNGPVYALTTHHDRLCVAGQFSSAGGQSATNVAAWGGSSWSKLASGIGGGWITDLAVHKDQLFACGVFTNAGDLLVSNIAQWNGLYWSALGSGVNAQARDLASFAGSLLVGGEFAVAGDKPSVLVARWDGQVGDSDGDGIPDPSDNCPAFPNSDQIGCPCHGDPLCDGVTDILDVIKGINVGYRQYPAIVDTTCPHAPAGRTDVDCSGETDIVDIVQLIGVAFGSVQRNFCNPCACSSYPTSCQ